MRYLVDVCVFLASVLPDEDQHVVARGFLAQAEDCALSAIAELELANALVRLVRRDRVDAQMALDMAGLVARWRIPRLDVFPQVPESLRLGLEGLAHPYDLVQVLTAREHHATFVTVDQRLAKSLAGHVLADSLLLLVPG